MDVADIGKVAGRKRMNTDVEKLREKVSRETAKIIKLKVAQDTAYWDLKERLQQLQGAHERLQQNMVDVQMQHEAASAQYTQELRLRPDTLNKLAGARGVCAALEEYGARLRRCVARGRADRAALQAAYAACGARVHSLAGELARAREVGAALRQAGRESGARANSASRQLADLRELLGAARAAADERAAARDALAARLRQADEAAAAMRDEVARLVRQFDAQTQHLQQSRARLEDEARAAGAEAARLQRKAEALAGELRAAQAQLADAQKSIEHMKQTEAIHVNEINNLEKVVKDKSQLEEEMEAEITRIKERVGQLETETLEASEQLRKSEQECGALRTALGELSSDAEQLRTRLAAEQQAQRAQRDADAARIDELCAAAADKERELDASTGAIARLMADFKSESDARARSDGALQAARRQHEAEMQAARATEQQLRDAAARLDQTVKAKDDELSAQMTIILNTRGEKERLHERIQGMQKTIDNIQKELTGRLAAPKGGADRREAEQDAGPHAGPQPAELYGFLSDGSVEGDALDPREVKRRFQALARGEVRGELLRAAQGPISLSQMKGDLKMKSRTFFKNKRLDSKSKKFK